MRLKNQEEWTLRMSRETCNYIYMYINAVAKSAKLQVYLRHFFEV
jgi:hypothetical protein